MKHYLVSFLLFSFMSLFIVTPSLAEVASEKPTSTAAQSPKKVISINKASAQILADTLMGVGLKKAEEIVAWREKNGAFTAIEQLLEVKGIGGATLAKNRHLIGL